MPDKRFNIERMQRFSALNHLNLILQMPSREYLCVMLLFMLEFIICLGSIVVQLSKLTPRTFLSAICL